MATGPVREFEQSFPQQVVEDLKRRESGMKVVNSFFYNDSAGTYDYVAYTKPADKDAYLMGFYITCDTTAATISMYDSTSGAPANSEHLGAASCIKDGVDVGQDTLIAVPIKLERGITFRVTAVTQYYTIRVYIKEVG
jgi:hypothetical protein